jgi:hypothetical protein
MAKRNIPAALTALGHEKITTNSTVKTLNTTTIAGSTFLVSVETQSARLRFDGGTPAATTGVLLLAANSPYWFKGIRGSQIKITGAVSGSILNIAAFKHTGE